MTNTTTQHIKSLLVDDGREFAMIRKTDLSALMAIAEKDPFLGRYLDPIGEFRYEAACFARREKILAEKVNFLSITARKHGEERRRYMANNKALQARNEQLSEWVSIACDASHAGQMAIMSIKRATAMAPATCRMLGLAP